MIAQPKIQWMVVNRKPGRLHERAAIGEYQADIIYSSAETRIDVTLSQGSVIWHQKRLWRSVADVKQAVERWFHGAPFDLPANETNAWGGAYRVSS